jgi:hypothetical protein
MHGSLPNKAYVCRPKKKRKKKKKKIKPQKPAVFCFLCKRKTWKGDVSDAKKQKRFVSYCHLYHLKGENRMLAIRIDF